MSVSRQINTSDISVLRYPVLPAARKMILFGDIFVSQSDAVSGNSTQAKGGSSFATWVNILTQYRFNRLPSPSSVTGPYNFGLNGDTTTNLLARMASPLAAAPDIVMLVIGGNDIAAGTLAAPIVANLQSIVQQFNAIGAVVLWATIIPRLAANVFSSTQISNALAVNQAMRRWAQTQRGFFLVDMDPVMLDLTASTWVIPASYLTDNVHPTQLGGTIYSQAIANVLNQLYPNWRVGQKSGSDSYDATNNISGNLLPNGFMLGTSGTVTVATGTAANSTTVDATSAGGATVVASKGTLLDGSPAQVVVVSGSTTGNAKVITITQSFTSLSNVAANDVLEAEVSYEVGANTNISGVNTLLASTESSTAYFHEACVVAGTDNYQTAGFSSTLRLVTPQRVVTAQPSQAYLQTKIFLTNGSVSPTGTFKFGAMSVRKIF